MFTKLYVVVFNSTNLLIEPLAEILNFRSLL